MSNKETVNSDCITPLCIGLTILFLALRAFGAIDWDWWLVLMPVWVYFVVIIGAVIVVWRTAKRNSKRIEEYKKNKENGH